MTIASGQEIGQYLEFKQWGKQAGNINSVSFPIAYSHTPLWFGRLPLRDSTGEAVYQDFCYTTISISGFTSTTQEGTLNHVWIAIGC